jgi:Domain of unknown function (DUF4112)
MALPITPPDKEFVDVEVIPPPRKRPVGGQSTSEFDSLIGFMSRLMDSLFRVPGTRVRFGLDPLVGLIPIVGSQLSACVSAALLFRSVQHRLPKIVLARMGLNIAINAVLDAVPFVGDFLSIFFKSNDLNYALLKRYAGQGKPVTRGDWIFVGTVVGAAFFIGIATTLLVGYAIVTQFRWW